MDIKKIGSFIRNLREEKKLTQQQLSEKLLVHRTTLNKWEKGHSLPLNDSLILLSEIFDISIDEILSGERKNDIKNKENVIFHLLNNYRKSKKIILIISSLLVFSLFTFFGYYFFTNYNSIKVYRISGESENYLVTDGILFISKHKMYFKMGEINTKTGDTPLLDIELYSKLNEENKLIYKGSANQLLIDNYYSEEYFNYNEIIKQDRLFLKICHENDCEDIKLSCFKDFQNSSFIYKKENNSIDNNDNDNDNDNSVDEEIPNYIKENFEFNEQNNNYTKKEQNKLFFYNQESKIFLLKINNKNIEKNYQYNLNTKELYYFEFDTKEKKIVKEINNYDNEYNSIYEAFYKKYILNILE